MRHQHVIFVSKTAYYSRNRDVNIYSVTITMLVSTVYLLLHMYYYIELVHTFNYILIGKNVKQKPHCKNFKKVRYTISSYTSQIVLEGGIQKELM